MTTDASEAQKEALLKAGKPSDETKPKPSATPEMLTKDQAEKIADEKHSKLDRKVFELEKAATRSEEAIKAATRRAEASEEALSEAEKARDKAELEGARDNPDALAIYTAKVAVKEAQSALRKEKDQLADEKREHAADIEDAKEHRKTGLANEIAAELSVSAQTLLAITDGTEEKMRAAAEHLPKVVAQPPGSPQAPPDSGLGSGAGKPLSEKTIEEQTAMSDEEWFKQKETEQKPK